MEVQERDCENPAHLKQSEKLNNGTLADTSKENANNGQIDGSEGEFVIKTDNTEGVKAKFEKREKKSNANPKNDVESTIVGNLDIVEETFRNEKEVESHNEIETCAIPCDFAFDVRIVEENLNSVCIDWTLMADAEVYKIEKYHRRRGWEQVAWVGYAPTTIGNLAESFTYRLRIKAQRFCETRGFFEDCKMSPEFLVTTLSPLPTTLSLHRAIKKGQQFLVKRILRRRKSLLEYPGPNGYLPLANAIVNGQNSVIDVLLSNGANVHVGNMLNARTPLQLAFYHGRLPVARILLNRKAQLEAADINGMTACHFAVDANQLELLRFALENGANVNATDACGWSLLSRAVVMGADVCILKLLLMHGADAKSTDKMGKTSVDLAKIYKNTVAAEYFAKALRSK